MNIDIDYSQFVEDAGQSTEQVVHGYLHELAEMGFIDSYLRKVGINEFASGECQSPFQSLSGEEISLPDPKGLVTAEMLDGSGIDPQSKILIPDDPLLARNQKWGWYDSFELVDGGLFTVFGGGFLSLFAWINQREFSSSEIGWLKRVATDHREASNELSRVL